MSNVRFPCIAPFLLRVMRSLCYDSENCRFGYSGAAFQRLRKFQAIPLAFRGSFQVVERVLFSWGDVVFFYGCVFRWLSSARGLERAPPVAGMWRDSLRVLFQRLPVPESSLRWFFTSTSSVREAFETFISALCQVGCGVPANARGVGSEFWIMNTIRMRVSFCNQIIYILYMLSFCHSPCITLSPAFPSSSVLQLNYACIV